MLVASSFGAPLIPISIPNLLLELNMTFSELFPSHLNASDFVYTYSQSAARFRGPAYDGGTIDVVGCSGMKESCPSGGGEVKQQRSQYPLPPHPRIQCRNNPNTQCCKNCGPCPRGEWRLSQEIVFHNMQHCYALSPVGGQSCPDRDGFLIHGGDGTTCAGGNPSDGCIVIEDAAVRQKIKGGGTLNVVE